LTEAGQGFYERVLAVLEGLEEAEDFVSGRANTVNGTLKVSAPTSFGRMHIAPHLKTFMERHPDLSVNLVLSDEFIDIIEGGYDLAIRISSAPSDKFTIWRKIRAVPRILVAAPGSRFAQMKHPAELTPDDCLAYSGESRRENWVLSDGGSSITITAGRAFSANSGEVLADMAADGAGVALLPGFNIAQHIHSGRLVHVLPGWSPPELWLTLYYPPYQALPPRIATFSKFFEEQLPAYMVALE